MTLLLVGINAKYIHSNPAIYSLAAYAGKFTDKNEVSLCKHIEIAEYTINQQLEDIEADIYKKKPDVIALSCYIWNISMVYSLISDLHKVMPDVPIWLGGPEVSFHPEKLLQRFPFLAGIMIGEGEQTFVELLQWYLNAESVQSEKEQPGDSINSSDGFKEIAGLYLLTGYTGERDCLSMDEIPFLYGDLKEFENRILYYESSRGCPFRCKYCLSSIDKQLRFRSFELVKKELQFFLDNQVPQVKFIDRTFNAKHEHAMTVWSYIKEHDNGITNFHFEISADLLTEEEINLLQSMREGLVQLEIGVQSTNQDTISEINRTMNLDKLRLAVEKVNAGGNIHQHLDLIAGLPYEDYASFYQSFNDVYSMEPEQLQLGFLKVLKGSAMEEQADEYGLVYREETPYEVLSTKWLSYEDVISLKQIEEMVELFYNSGQFTYTVKFLEKMTGDAFVLYEKLASYYEKKGYLLASSKRIAHYEHLLDFVKELLNEESTQKLLSEERNAAEGVTELCREYLLFDCYLRENMKTAPSFAKDLSSYKAFLREFYQREEQEREYLPSYTDFDSKQLAKMTHIEFFHYPVWEKEFVSMADILNRKTDVPMPVLFDYRERSKISKDCRFVVLTGVE